MDPGVFVVPLGLGVVVGVCSLCPDIGVRLVLNHRPFEKSVVQFSRQVIVTISDLSTICGPVSRGAGRRIFAPIVVLPGQAGIVGIVSQVRMDQVIMDIGIDHLPGIPVPRNDQNTQKRIIPVIE